MVVALDIKKIEDITYYIPIFMLHIGINDDQGSNCNKLGNKFSIATVAAGRPQLYLRARQGIA